MKKDITNLDNFREYLVKEKGFSGDSAKSYESYLNGINKNVPTLSFWDNIKKKQNIPLDLQYFLKSVQEEISKGTIAQTTGRSNKYINNWHSALNHYCTYIAENTVPITDNENINTIAVELKENLVKMINSTTKKEIKERQTDLLTQLNQIYPDILWDKEYQVTEEHKDKVDIVGFYLPKIIVIELDAHRADQVSKKFVSRMALYNNAPDLLYIALCYPGTENMNIKECKKYFEYCQTLTQALSTSSKKREFLGLFCN
ncbi:MAG: hypothetical protein ACRCSB_06250 [Bacteroidales bacterium]